MARRETRSLKRIQIDMTEAAFERLQWLQKETRSMTMTEVIRDSLEIREAIVKLRNDGKNIYAEDQKTGDKAMLIFPRM